MLRRQTEDMMEKTRACFIRFVSSRQKPNPIAKVYLFPTRSIVKHETLKYSECSLKRSTRAVSGFYPREEYIVVVCV